MDWLKRRRLNRAITEKQTLITKNCDGLKARLQTTDLSLVESRERILSLPTGELLAELREKRVSAVAVLQAFQFKAIEATEATNCVTDFVLEAEEWAKELDSSHEIRGPLHGLPVSIKDSYPFKGYDYCIGLAQHINKLADKDSVIVQSLKELGAIPFARTNIPQTMLCFDSSNPVFGTTLNPVLRNRTSGGSSSGEGALIKYGGSIMGIGSDIAGSVRVPAHFCGISSLKPTKFRISGCGGRPSLPGQVGLAATPGLMTRDVDGLVLGFRSLTQLRILELDPLMPPLEFRTQLFESTNRLRIGYVVFDGFMHPTPGCKRAVVEAKAALENQGHELVPFVIPDPHEAWDLSFACMFADGGKNLMAAWKRDILDPSSWITYYALVSPKWIKAIVAKIMGYFYPEVKAAFKHSNGCSGAQLWSVLARREAYVRGFASKWKREGLDALLCPGFAVPAPPPLRMQKLLSCAQSTMLYNLLDFPAGIVPVTTENERDQKALREEYPKGGSYEILKKATLGAIGAPIGVQIVGLPWQDEQVLRVMKELETSLKNRQ